MMETIPIQSLIAIIATYRVFKINKELAIKAMEELDRRGQDGQITPLDRIDDLCDLLKSVGNGYVIKTADNEQIPDVISSLNEIGILGIKVSESTIFIGKIDQEKLSDIKNIVGVLDIQSDKETIENASSSKIPPFWQNT